MKIPVIVCGALGRMGREVIERAQNHDACAVVAGVIAAHRNHAKPSSWHMPLYDNLSDALAAHSPAVVIDFSITASAKVHLASAVEFRAPFLLATTGHSDDTLAAAADAASLIPVVVAPNTSLMANLLIGFCALASERLGQFEASILDLHHAQKKDAPSGTARAMAHAIMRAQPTQEIEIRSMRKGTNPGEHTAYFFGQFDRLELTHRVADRCIFAEGAIVSAQFLFGRVPGLYNMNDVLNLNITIKK